MKTEYAVEIYNKADDSLKSQVDVFQTQEEAEQCIKETGIGDSTCYLGIVAITYDDDGNEIGVERI